MKRYSFKRYFNKILLKMENFFRLNIVAMNQGGLWPLPHTRIREFFRKLNCVCSIIMSIILASAELWEGFDNYHNTAILVEAIAVASVAIINALKALTFLARRGYMMQILHTFNDLYENVPVQINNDKILNKIEKWKEQAHYITKVLIVIYLTPFFFYMAVPWFRFFKYDERIFQFPSKYPLDTSKLNNYLLIYTFEFVLSYVLIWTFIGAEAFFANAVLYICSRLEILKYSLTQATDEAKTQRKTTNQFVKTLEYHKTLLNSCEMIENIYSPVLLFQFFISMILLCVICFLTTLDITVDKQLTFFSFFVTMLAQIFVYCYYGQLLENAFEEFWYFSFHIHWYDAPISYQRDIKFLLMRCSKPVTLTAYKIMPVNMESYYAICKTSMSYLTMLQSMSN